MLPGSDVASGPSPMRRNTLPRRGSLKQRRLIECLFDRQRSDVYTTAFGCVRLLSRPVAPEEMESVVPVQVGFAPGRQPTAVVRNRIKRTLREVYRLHQQELVALFEARTDTLTLMVLFRGKQETASTRIPQDLPRALQCLVAHYRSQVK